MRLLLLLAACLAGTAALAQATRIDPLARIAPLAGLDESDRFGLATATEGRWAVVGAPSGYCEDGSGSVYVFERWPGGWALHSELRPGTGAALCQFGRVIALDGERLVVGANGIGGPGAVVVFEPLRGVWTEVARVQPPTLASVTDAVALSGDMMLIEEGDLSPPVVVERRGGVWTVTDTLAVDGWQYPVEAVLDGERAAVRGVRRTGDVWAAEVAVFERGSEGWTITYLVALPASSSDSRLALQGDRLVIGRSADEAAVADVYTRGPDGWAPDGSWALAPDLPVESGVEALVFDGDLLVAYVSARGPTPSRLVAVDLGDAGAPPTPLPVPEGYILTRPRLAMHGPRVLFGDPIFDTDGLDGHGRAVVIEREAEAWTLTPLTVPGIARRDRRFGQSVALDGSRMAVVATAPAAVHVYRSQGGGWIEEAMLPLQDPSGCEVPIALESDWLIVGAQTFTRSGVTWTEGRRLSRASGRGCPGPLALSGGRLLAGEPRADGGRGLVDLYEADGAIWRDTARLFGELGDTGFGHAVAIDGGRALVASRTRRTDGGFGTVAIYEAAGADWVRTGTLTPPSTGVFGDALGLGGGWAIAGAPIYSGPSRVVEAVRVNRGPFGFEVAALASPLSVRSLFGAALAIDGDRVLVGAPAADADGAEDVGAAFLFEHDGRAWSEAREVPRPVGLAGARFGSAVAVDGQRLLVGAPGDPTDARAAGAAYLYASSFATPSDAAPEPAWAGLSPPVPHPARGRARFVLTVDGPSHATVTLHDALGRQVRVLLDRPVADRAEVEVATDGLAVGLYIARATWDTGASTQHLVVVR